MRLFRRRRAEQPGITIDPNQGDPNAARLRAWMEARDWPAARDFLNSVTDPDDRAFYLSVCSEVPGVQDWIGDVVAAEPDSTLPLLVKGAHGVFWAWEARGAKAAKHTSQEQFREFGRRLKMAENCLDEVVERHPDDTTAWAFLVASARGRGVDRSEALRRFSEVVKRHPHHLVAHEHMLQYLCAKWYGSHEEALLFARDAIAAAPDGSPVGHLVAVAHIENWLRLPEGEDDAYIESAEVVAELNAAADRSVRHPDFRRRPGWPGAHNSFAMAFVLAGDARAAAEQMEIIGDHLLTSFPWEMAYSPVEQKYLMLRAAARAEAARSGSTPPG